MSRLVPISEWNRAVKAVAADSDEVKWALGYRSGRRLPGDNPIFEPLRELLRQRGEWHGTPVQLQRDLGDTRYCTAFGQLLSQAIPFLAAEFRWEKHTMPKWGVVQFLKRKDSQRCQTRGCFDDALARGRCQRCFSYLHAHHPGWQDDADLTWMRPCCFRECRNDLDAELIADAEFPVCTYHKRCIHWRMMAEDCVGEEAASGFPWDEEWLSARFLHVIRKGTATIRSSLTSLIRRHQVVQLLQEPLQLGSDHPIGILPFRFLDLSEHALALGDQLMQLVGPGLVDRHARRVAPTEAFGQEGGADPRART